MLRQMGAWKSFVARVARRCADRMRQASWLFLNSFDWPEASTPNALSEVKAIQVKYTQVQHEGEF